MAHLPLIGITLDYQETGSFSKRPHYAVRTAYFEAVAAAGGLPIAIPHLADSLQDYLRLIDGLVVPGGGFATPEAWYVDPDEPKAYADSPRAEFDIAIIEGALERDLPLLGICAGMQELACVSGGRMTRNVHKFHKTSVDHKNGRPHEFAHDVVVESGTRLAAIVGSGRLPVNTAHVEAIVSVPAPVKVTARSPDGVIEAIELPDRKFAIGVQWHPEFFIAEAGPHLALFQALVDAARQAPRAQTAAAPARRSA
ncbi:MAG: gamma-glutamyl-gamma-aminobutyrate hydrolase family protein [Proteobacteria bacterium]|nr:gamma-glutamyl-gamma-aminobutyrate hydrolase family protein [Pseudomonadota bacterium]